MEQTFRIGEIAEFFGLPASTLRFWEEKGLLTPEKNTQNSYREYQISDLITLSDTIFYKNIGIPLKQICEMRETTPDEHRQLFEEKLRDLKRQQKELQQRTKKLQRHLEAIDTLRELQMHPFLETEIDTECIVSFDLLEIDKLRQYIENPYLYSRVQHSDHPDTEQRGLTILPDQIHAFSDRQKIWKNDHRHTYITCLMKEKVSKDYPNNLKELLSHVQKEHQTGYIISRFLLSAQEDDILYDYYKTYIEILS
ncbi:MAG: MerR family DNA-binding transcriptional regulator [Lachnospiraceae bacterium]